MLSIIERLSYVIFFQIANDLSINIFLIEMYYKNYFI